MQEWIYLIAITFARAQYCPALTYIFDNICPLNKSKRILQCFHNTLWCRNSTVMHAGIASTHRMHTWKFSLSQTWMRALANRKDKR
jgi:hypothetical protein